MELLPEWAGSYSTLGVFYYQTGQVEKAREVLNRFKGSHAGGLDVNRIEEALVARPGDNRLRRSTATGRRKKATTATGTVPSRPHVMTSPQPVVSQPEGAPHSSRFVRQGRGFLSGTCQTPRHGSSKPRGTRTGHPRLSAMKRPIALIIAICASAQTSQKTAVQFTDIRPTTGITFPQDSTQTDEKYYLETMGTGVAWIDYDQDGLMDLYFVQSAATDIYKPPHPLRCALYHNNGDGTFTDVTEKAGVGGEGHYGQGVAVGDFDNDGYPDLYVTGYKSAILYHNNGNGTFTDVTGKSGSQRRRRMVNQRRMVRLRQGWMARPGGHQLHRVVAEK